MNEPAVLVEGIAKSFGNVEALRGIDFSVAPGTVLGMLGPNGAGKTTAVRILTTLLRPSAGHARVLGHDVVRDAAAVRGVIGLAGQATALVDELTGRENLEMMARLHHLPKFEAKTRAGELLLQFDLEEAADRAAKTYSGGMRRRLDLASSLVSRPRVMFLDEPTTGLDPRSRLGMWDVIRRLVAEGTTLLLTTQYLDEADELADEIVVIDRGKVIASGTADALKNRVGGDVVEFDVTSADAVNAALTAIGGLGDGPATADGTNISVRVGNEGSRALLEVVRRLDANNIAVAGLGVRRPSLDDVFMALTGHVAEAGAEDGAQ